MSVYSTDLLEKYRSVTTATLTTVLFKKGIRNAWLRGTSASTPIGIRIAGPAFTMRFVPAREDLATMEGLGSPRSSRAAIEAMPSGCVAVIDSASSNRAGVVGDILCQRMQARGVAGLVTDGPVRDVGGIVETGLPVWSNGAAAPPSTAGLLFVGWGEPIGCGGVAVMPDDLIVADGDGAIVVPQALAEEIIETAAEQEEMENWILDEVRSGAPLTGLYPPNEQAVSRYNDTRKRKK